MVEHKCILNLKKEVRKMVETLEHKPSFDFLLRQAAEIYKEKRELPTGIRKQFIEAFRALC